MIADTLTSGQMALKGGGLTVLAGALWATSGVWAVALVAIVGLLWIVLPTAYIVATGQLLYAVLLADPGLFGALGTVSFVALFVPELIRQWGLRTAVLATVVLGVTTAALASSVIVGSLTLAALAICLGFAVAAYSIHRYELVRFGLVEHDQ